VVLTTDSYSLKRTLRPKEVSVCKIAEATFLNAVYFRRRLGNFVTTKLYVSFTKHKTQSKAV
jgi:hypothetical protein